VSQKNQILGHMRRHKTITPLEALDKFGCLRLAARIQNLRDSGYKIATEWVRKGEKRFARYRLVA